MISSREVRRSAWGRRCRRPHRSPPGDRTRSHVPPAARCPGAARGGTAPTRDPMSCRPAPTRRMRIHLDQRMLERRIGGVSRRGGERLEDLERGEGEPALAVRCAPVHAVTPKLRWTQVRPTPLPTLEILAERRRQRLLDDSCADISEVKGPPGRARRIARSVRARAGRWSRRCRLPVDAAVGVERSRGRCPPMRYPIRRGTNRVRVDGGESIERVLDRRARSSARLTAQYRSSESSQPSTQPGIVIDHGLRIGISVEPSLRASRRFAGSGAARRVENGRSSVPGTV